MYRSLMEGLAAAFLNRFGTRLTKRYGNQRVADWILAYARFFNTRGAAELWNDAPWFWTCNPNEEEDCALHPMNNEPVSYFRHRGSPPWWERGPFGFAGRMYPRLRHPIATWRRFRARRRYAAECAARALQPPQPLDYDRLLELQES